MIVSSARRIGAGMTGAVILAALLAACAVRGDRTPLPASQISAAPLVPLYESDPVRTLGPHARSYTCSWLGNTFSGKDGAFVSQWCDAIYAAPDGTVFTNTFYDEGTHEVSAFREATGEGSRRGAARMVGAAYGTHGAPASDGAIFHGGSALAGSGKFLFVGQVRASKNSGKETHTFGFTVRDITQPARAYPGVDLGSGGQPGPGNTRCFVPVTTLPPDGDTDFLRKYQRYSLRGMTAVELPGGVTRVFVATPPPPSSTAFSVRVFDLRTKQDGSSGGMTVEEVRGWGGMERLERPGAIGGVAYDTASSSLWVLQRAEEAEGKLVSPAKVFRLAVADGVARSNEAFVLSAAPGEKPYQPVAIAMDNRYNRLLLADRGPRNQIHVFDAPARAIGQGKRLPTGALGQPGGGYAAGGGLAPGHTGPGRFFSPRCVASDSTGNVYLSMVGPGFMNVIECYDSSAAHGSGRTGLGPLRWSVGATEGSATADLDPADESTAYTPLHCYTFDANEKVGPQWRVKGHTADPQRYPWDHRLRSQDAPWGTRIRRIQGRKYLFVQYPGGLCIFRFEGNSLIALPSVVITGINVSSFRERMFPHCPDTNWWIWRDRDGDGVFDANEYARPGTPAQSEPLGKIPNWEVDKRGDLWALYQDGVKLIRLSLQGVDPRGNLIYDTPGTGADTSRAIYQEEPIPAPFGYVQEIRAATGQAALKVSRLVYEPTSDAMFLTGWTADWPRPFAGQRAAGRFPFTNPALTRDASGKWVSARDETDAASAGKVIARYNAWSGGPPRSGGRTAAWVRPLAFRLLPGTMAFDAQNIYPASVSVTGDYLFVGYAQDSQILIYDAATGEPLRQSLRPDVHVVSHAIGALDIRQAIHASRRSNGEYMVFSEANFCNRVLAYRWRPPAYQMLKARTSKADTPNGLDYWEAERTRLNRASDYPTLRAYASPDLHRAAQSVTSSLSGGEPHNISGLAPNAWYRVRLYFVAGEQPGDIRLNGEPTVTDRLTVPAGSGSGNKTLLQEGMAPSTAQGTIAVTVSPAAGARQAPRLIDIEALPSVNGTYRATPADPVYRATPSRPGDLHFRLPALTPGAWYQVRLHLREPSPAVKPGQRVFGVRVKEVNVRDVSGTELARMDLRAANSGRARRDILLMADDNGEILLSVEGAAGSSLPPAPAVEAVEVVPSLRAVYQIACGVVGRPRSRAWEPATFLFDEYQGGDAWVGPGGQSWLVYAHAGKGGGYGPDHPIYTEGVRNPAPTTLYRNGRRAVGEPPTPGKFRYEFPNLRPGGVYTLRVHFCETEKERAGERRMDVFLNGSLWKDDLDLFVAGGNRKNQAFVLERPITAGKDGKVTLEFVTVPNARGMMEHGGVSGIEILEPEG